MIYDVCGLLWLTNLPIPVVVGWEFPAIQLRGNATGCPFPHSSRTEFGYVHVELVCMLKTFPLCQSSFSSYLLKGKRNLINRIVAVFTIRSSRSHSFYKTDLVLVLLV